MSGTPSWSDAARQDALTLWNAGEGAAAIAARLGKTRNAVLGLLWRMGARKRGVESAQKTAQMNSGRRPARPPRVQNGPLKRSEIALAPERSLPSAPPPARLDAGGCRFIEGSPSPDESCFCNLPKRPGSSYCRDHHQRCYAGFSTGATA